MRNLVAHRIYFGDLELDSDLDLVGHRSSVDRWRGKQESVKLSFLGKFFVRNVFVSKFFVIYFVKFSV